MPSLAKIRVLLWVGVALWAVSWLLPCHASDNSDYRGHQCYTVTLGFLPGLLLEPMEKQSPASFVQFAAMSVSPWLKLLFAVSLVVTHFRRPAGLFRRLAPVLFLAATANLVWLVYGSSLRFGYFAWAASFWLFGFAVLGLARQGKGLARSPFIPTQAGASVAQGLEIGVPVVALVAFFLLAQTALAKFVERAKEVRTKKESAAATQEPATPAKAPEDAAAQKEREAALRREEIWRFIEGYTQVSADRTKEGSDFAGSFKAQNLQTSTRLEGCDLTVTQTFRWPTPGDARLLEMKYAVPLGSLAPSPLSSSESFTRRWTYSSLELIESYPFAVLRLQTTNSADSIGTSWRNGGGATSTWQRGRNQDEVLVGVASWKIEVTRVRNAFAELIQLCGGRPEPF